MDRERREFKRYPSNVITRVRVLVPEETFSPYVHEAVIMDISERGMKLRTQDIDEATYKMLLGSTRMVRITFTPPETEKAHTLFGKIVWIDYNNLVHPPITKYGICLENISEEDRRVIHLCLKTLSEATRE